MRLVESPCNTMPYVFATKGYVLREEVFVIDMRARVQQTIFVAE